MLISPTGTMASFPRQLNSLDRHLGCVFNPDIKRFIITWQRQDRSFLTLMRVENEDGTFRHPDTRDLCTLKKWDMEERRIRDVMREIAEYMVKTREKDRKDSRDMIKNATKDNKNQLIKAFAKLANVSKGNSAFRRIRDKARGQVY